MLAGMQTLGGFYITKSIYEKFGNPLLNCGNYKYFLF